jgi:hypothetical protein
MHAVSGAQYELTSKDCQRIINRNEGELNSLARKIHIRKVMAPWIGCCCCPCNCLPITLGTVLCCPIIGWRLLEHDEDILAKCMQWCGCVAPERMPLNRREVCCVVCCTPCFMDLPDDERYYSSQPERQRMLEAAGLIQTLSPRAIASEGKEKEDQTNLKIDRS